MPKHEPGGCFVQAFPNYCVLTGRESSGPASRGFAQLEPRRRNDRQIISLAANTQVGQKRFLPTFSRLKKQVAARHRAKGSRRLSADIPAHTCGEVWPQSGIEHPMHGCMRPRPLTRASKDAKRPFPRHQAGYALRRPRRRRTSCEGTQSSSYRQTSENQFLCRFLSPSDRADRASRECSQRTHYKNGKG